MGGFCIWKLRGIFCGGKMNLGERTMKGYKITDESYHDIGDRTTACVLTLENGYEITGTHCLDLSDLAYGEERKKKAFESAYNKYLVTIGAYRRQQIYGMPAFLTGGETNEQAKEPV
jgi:hypothetical protein